MWNAAMSGQIINFPDRIQVHAIVLQDIFKHFPVFFIYVEMLCHYVIVEGKVSVIFILNRFINMLFDEFNRYVGFLFPVIVHIKIIELIEIIVID